MAREDIDRREAESWVLTCELACPLVELDVDEVLGDGVAFEALGQIAQLLHTVDRDVEALQRDVDVQLVDLPFHPAEVALLAVDLDEQVRAVLDLAERAQQAGVAGDGRVAGCEVVHCVLGLGAHLVDVGALGAAELVEGAFEREQEVAFLLVAGAVAAVREGRFAVADGDGVGDVARFLEGAFDLLRARGQVRDVDVLQLETLLRDEFGGGLLGGGAGVHALAAPDGDEEVVVQEDDVDGPSRLPGRGVELDPEAGLEHDMPARDGRKRLL